MRTYKIPHGEYHVHDDYVETVYDDGVVASGKPTYDEEQRARAVALGYEDSEQGVWEMHVEHELLHSVVAEAIGRERSAALYGWQTKTNKLGEIPQEERMVFLLQRALNIGREIIDERQIL